VNSYEYDYEPAFSVKGVGFFDYLGNSCSMESLVLSVSIHVTKTVFEHYHRGLWQAFSAQLVHWQGNC
jgi:hypothetical protein